MAFDRLDHPFLFTLDPVLDEHRNVLGLEHCWSQNVRGRGAHADIDCGKIRCRHRCEHGDRQGIAGLRQERREGHDRRGHRAEAKAAAKELGGDASDAIADVTNLAELEKMAKSAARRNGGIDVLCANAGIFPQARIEDMSPEQWDAVLATNLKGTFLAVKACVPYLKKSAAGRIVITSSITGPITGFPGWTHYERRNPASSAFYAPPRSSSRNTGSPSTRSCPATSSPRGWSRSGRNTTTMAASIPLKRLGTVEDIGYAALFLASKEAGYITGQTIVVDGGQILPESLEALKD